MVTIEHTETRQDIDECLAHLNHEAKRCLYGTERWADMHRVIDLLLTKREALDG